MRHLSLCTHRGGSDTALCELGHDIVKGPVSQISNSAAATVSDTCSLAAHSAHSESSVMPYRLLITEYIPDRRFSASAREEHIIVYESPSGAREPGCDSAGPDRILASKEPLVGLSPALAALWWPAKEGIAHRSRCDQVWHINTQGVAS
jgi:hypothetical protein